MAAWDLTALVNAADARAPQAERHLWLSRLLEWLRQARLDTTTALSPAEPRTPRPVLRLRLLLNALDSEPALRAQVQGMLQAFWRETDTAALFADFGFGSRQSLWGELLDRLQRRWLPGTPETTDLAALFDLLFDVEDITWVAAVDAATLQRLAALLIPTGADARTALLPAVTMLAGAVQAAGYAPALRQRIEPALLKNDPFRQLALAAEALRLAVIDGRHDDALREAAYLRAVLDACRRAAGSVSDHLESFGVSAGIVYEMSLLQRRADRIDQLLNCVLAPEPVAEWHRLIVELLRVLGQTQGVRALLSQHYGLLGRVVTERSAETGEHYITRNRGEYRDMLRRAAGGGMVLAATTFAKFGIAAIGLTAFWTGFWSSANYALSFLLVMMLHWTVATKQPAMTAPAMAASLRMSGGAASEAEIEGFVDRVAQLIRSQAAGIAGNLLMCGPLVLLVQLLATAVSGAPVVGKEAAQSVLHSLTLLGPTALFAAFTGVLLFASSLVAGWAENWFVFHRLESAIARNPGIVARLGAARAQRWATWWRANVSGVAANVSLGMMLGLTPAVAGFLGLGLEVRHVTLSTGQLCAALGALGWPVLKEPAFWWCVAGIAATGLLNVGVSFWLAFKLALNSRGVRTLERRRIGVALWCRVRAEPMSFVRPPRE